MNHAAIAGGVGAALKSARERVGHVHKLAVEVRSEQEVRDAIEASADVLAFARLNTEECADLIARAREFSGQVGIEVSGRITLENVRAYAEAGADLIRVDALTQSIRAMDISFQIQPG